MAAQLCWSELRPLRKGGFFFFLPKILLKMQGEGITLCGQFYSKSISSPHPQDLQSHGPISMHFTHIALFKGNYLRKNITPNSR